MILIRGKTDLLRIIQCTSPSESAQSITAMAFAKAKPQSKNETTEISISPYCPVPAVRHVKGKCPMDGHRPVEHRPIHRKLFKITRAGVNDGDKYGAEFSRDGENLPAGEDIL